MSSSALDRPPLDRRGFLRAAGGMGAAVLLAGGLAAPTAEAAAPRTIAFSGRTWTVKGYKSRVGPGPNYFSSSPNNVWVDSSGALHLKITKSAGKWYCAEVICNEAPGYGTYRFSLDSAVGGWDPSVVLGLFTWSDALAYHNQEIDIEFARWGSAANLNAQYVVQPYDTVGNMVRFNEPAATQTLHSFTWRADSVAFSSLDRDTGGLISGWTYSGGDVPVFAGANPRMNLWLFQGRAPVSGKAVEVVISGFEHVPLV
ncbi:MAG: glycoside hydrolase family 16 protein [Chloroflexota bacterium]